MKFNISSKSKNLKAFSLIELLIVMAIFSFVAVALLPQTVTQVKVTSLNGQLSELNSLIYQYQQNAFFGLNNKNYGVRFASNSYTIFIGNSYAAADSRETINLEVGNTISQINLAGGATDLIFSKGTLKPNTTGNIRVTNGSETYQLTINSEGYTEYEKI